MVNLSYFVLLSKQIFSEMMARKLRSFLALFCVSWGTLTVILLLALGSGFEDVSRKNMMSVVDGAFFIIFGSTEKQYNGLPKGRFIYVKSSDVVDLPQYIPGLKTVTPLMIQSDNVSFKSKQVTKIIYGVSSSFISMRKLDLTKGSRFFNDKEDISGRRVVVIGNKLKKILFGNSDALGNIILIKNIPFSVIGVIEKPAENADNRYDDALIIPYKAFIANWGDLNLSFFLAFFDPKQDSVIVNNILHKYFSYKYHFDITDKTALKIFSSSKMLEFFTWFFFGIKLFLGICGVLTLGVGCLGITNIMFLMVTERKREIGLRKALGAYDWQIFMQILMESIIIVGVGGLIGFLFAYLVILFLGYVHLPEWLGVPTISKSISLIIIIILGSLGVISGFFPAKRAAMMEPARALIK